MKASNHPGAGRSHAYAGQVPSRTEFATSQVPTIRWVTVLPRRCCRTQGGLTWHQRLYSFLHFFQPGSPGCWAGRSCNATRNGLLSRAGATSPVTVAALARIAATRSFTELPAPGLVPVSADALADSAATSAVPSAIARRRGHRPVCRRPVPPEDNASIFISDPPIPRRGACYGVANSALYTRACLLIKLKLFTCRSQRPFDL